MRRTFFGALALATVALTVVFVGSAGATKPPPPPTTNGGCPTGFASYVTDPNVGASSSGTTTQTFSFSSWVNENPKNGVPGLVGYCVYTNTSAQSVTASYDSWKASKITSKEISFQRPGGDKTNIPLDGTQNITIGTADFTDPPTSETILLHVSDAAECQALYGGTSTTCFVLPGPKPGPICNAGTGNTNAAYNAIPTDVIHCGPPALGFEAQSVNEFGDEVTLDTNSGANTKLVSMRVDFQSYGCSVSGHWYNGDCVSSTADMFTIPPSGTDTTGGITASIYDPNGSGGLTTPIATATNTAPIPYRPSADAVNCTGTDVGKWFDAVSGTCSNSYSVPITFTFSGGITLPSTVVWTVKFDTSTAGYNPIVANDGTQLCNSAAGGCGYDSLNVGAMSYPNAPYAGTDVAEDVAFISTGSGALVSQAGWTGFRPLGEIVLGP